MSLKAFLIQKLSLLFMLTTLITIAIYVTGSVFDPDAQLSYNDIISPLVYAFCCVLPTLVTYSRRELTLRELVPRMALELVMIEAVMLFLAYRSPVIDTSRLAVVLTIAGSVLAIYILARLLSWIRESAEARHLNTDLQEFQKQHFN